MLTNTIEQSSVGLNCWGTEAQLLTLRWINSPASGIRWGKCLGKRAEQDKRRNVHCFEVATGEAWELLNWELYALTRGVICQSHSCLKRDECPAGKVHTKDSVGGGCADKVSECNCHRVGIWSDCITCAPRARRVCEEHRGWSNSRTGVFWLYFSQEMRLLSELLCLRRDSDHGIHPNKAITLFWRALKSKEMEPLDDWLEGPINVLEILAFVKEQYK